MVKERTECGPKDDGQVFAFVVGVVVEQQQRVRLRFVDHTPLQRPACDSNEQLPLELELHSARAVGSNTVLELSFDDSERFEVDVTEI